MTVPVMDEERWRFLKQLLATPGPSGFETQAAALWREQARFDGAEISSDVMGNSFAVFNPGGSPTALLVGHLDEIGVIVQFVDDDGFIHIAPIGGWDIQVLVGNRIRFLTKAGPVIGLVGRKPIHLIPKTDRDKAAALSDLWVDVGARSGKEAAGLVSVGDPGVIDSSVVDLPNGRLASRAIDNRVGAFVVLEAARRYVARGGKSRVVVLAATQEEIGHRGGGALVGALRHAPTFSVVVDVSFATDHPGMEKKELGSHRIGGGPILSRGGLLSPVLFAMARTVAESHHIPYSIQANAGATGTDADAVVRSGSGVPVALVSIPCRYLHTPNELVSLDDLNHAATLISELIRSVSTETDFTAR